MPRDHRLYLDDIVGAIDRILSYVEGEVPEDWHTEPPT
jgi:uncharacterized protein with HEPN domain